MMSSFDEDTALTDSGLSRFRGEIREHWFVGRGANGGLLAAQAVRAMRRLEPDAERLPLSVTLHYLAAPAAGEISIAGVVERRGRSTTAVSLRFEQDGKVVALALGALAVWRGGSREHQVLVPPRVKPPGAVEPVPDDLPGLPAFTRNYRYRWAVEAAGAGSEPRVGGWIATREARPVDHVSLAAFADAFPPAVFTLLDGRTAAAPTIDLTIHFRAPILPAGWVLAAFETGQLAGGRFEEDGELWSEDGVLLAQSRQLAFLREPAP